MTYNDQSIPCLPLDLPSAASLPPQKSEISMVFNFQVWFSMVCHHTIYKFNENYFIPKIIIIDNLHRMFPWWKQPNKVYEMWILIILVAAVQSVVTANYSSYTSTLSTVDIWICISTSKIFSKVCLNHYNYFCIPPRSFWSCRKTVCLYLCLWNNSEYHIKVNCWGKKVRDYWNLQPLLQRSPG